METSQDRNIKYKQEEMSFKDFLMMLIKWFKYLRKNAIILLIMTVVGLGLGFLRYFLAKPKFRAVTTLVLNEGGQSSSSTLSMLGLEKGEAADLFQGNNLKWLYHTNLMLKQLLLAPIKRNGKDQLVIDVFLREDKKAAEIMKKNPVFRTVKFSKADIDSSDDLLKNQVFNICIGLINANLKVRDIDKTDGVIEIAFLSEKDTLAKSIADILVQTVNKYYVDSKTEKAQRQVDELEAKANEYNSRMSTTLYQTASSIDAVPYPNPNNQVNMVPAKRKGVDAEVNTALYTQIVRNLEVAKAELQKATPIIQVIDAPVFPLPVERPGMMSNLLLGALAGFFLTAIFLLIKNIIKETLAG